MHNLVKSYLVHYAYVETLQAYEDEEMDWEGHKDEKDTNTRDDEADQVLKETEIEKAAQMAASKAIKAQSNVFPGLSQSQMKQVQRKKALESKEDETNDRPFGRATEGAATQSKDPLRLKQRKMTEDDKKVRFMIDQMGSADNVKDDSPFK